jgi:NDP-sugar pyrophosphorylase family protein
MSGEGPARHDITAIVLAGGLGMRVRALHPDVPKPMIAVGGRPILHWITAWLVAHGIRHVVYSTGYRGDLIERWCRDASFPGVLREIVHEGAPLGTAGGLFNALPRARRTVIVVNGDSLCLGGLAELVGLGECENPAFAGGLIGIPVDDASRYGSLDIGADGCLLAFREKQHDRASRQAIVNAGVYRFYTAALARHRRADPSSIERHLIPDLLAAGSRLKVVVAGNAPFIDFGTPESLAVADAFLEHHARMLS